MDNVQHNIQALITVRPTFQSDKWDALRNKIFEDTQPESV
jgi:hypothetical protein